MRQAPEAEAEDATLSRHEAYMRRRAARLEAEAAAPDETEPEPEAALEKGLARRGDPVTLSEPEPEPEPELSPEMEADAPPDSGARIAATWAALRPVPLDARHLTRNRLISASRDDPAHVAFDVLRTKLMGVLRKQGWSRVAITSATSGCGKSFVAANLAISLSRKAGLRTVLMDADLRRPSLARLFGVKEPGTMGRFLSGEIAPEDYLVRPAPNDLNIGEGLALGLNDRAESYAAEILQSPVAVDALAALGARLAPDVVIFDMPPALYHDDVLAFRPQFDGVLIVVAGGQSTTQELRDLKDRLGSDTPLLGVIMNRAEGEDITRYEY